MEKDFIRDDGKIRKCDANMSKMNIFEYVYCDIVYWRYFQDAFSYTLESFIEFFKYGFCLIFNIVLLIFTPITLLICAIICIKNSKKWMEEFNNKKIKGTRN